MLGMAVLIALLGLVALAWYGAPLWGWTAAVAVYFLGLFAVGGIETLGLTVAAVLLGVPLLVLNIRALRRALISQRLFTTFKQVLPPMSDTEREALEAGDTWWEADLFQGRPDWSKLAGYEMPSELPEREQRFLDNEVETLCRMLDEDDIVRNRRDLPPEAWEYIKKEGFFSLILPQQYGGRDFSTAGQSAVVTKIATRSISAAVTVMVPNSLGPGELLIKYGTQAQKDYWLPRLADGREVPCFALTGPDVGSDAASMPDYGVVCKGEHDGKEVVGIRVNFSKRYITLSSVATVVGLAFKLHDPDRLLGGDETDYGITCALVPADHPGVVIGDRHLPMGLAFQNGPVEGKDVFIPADWIIGGPQMAGKGWRMLMECLSVGRAISLPALAAAAGQVCYRMTGAYSRIRRQFRLPIGRFEGVQEGMARIGANAYKLEATRRLTCAAGDMGIKPSVISAIAKYHMTEMMRVSVNDAMDIHGGRAIIWGPRNYLGYAYQAVPVGITVEGANILTRNLMVFGQGAIRCHPYVFQEMEAVRDDDLAAFDRAFFAHAGYTINRGARALLLGLSGGRLASAPVSGWTGCYYQQLERMSSALALVSDLAMATLGGELKRKERLSARLGDVLSHLYLATAVLKYYQELGEREEDRAYVEWVLEDELYRIQEAFYGFFDNMPARPLALLLRRVVFPWGRVYRGPSDRTGRKVAESMMEVGGARQRLTAGGYWAVDRADDITGRMEAAMAQVDEAEPLYDRFLKLVAKGQVEGHTFEERLEAAVNAGQFSAKEADILRRFEAVRYDVVLTDAFPPQTVTEPQAGDPGGGSTAEASAQSTAA